MDYNENRSGCNVCFLFPWDFCGQICDGPEGKSKSVLGWFSDDAAGTSADCGRIHFASYIQYIKTVCFLANSLGIQAVHTWLGCVLAATVIAFPLMYRNARAAFEQVDENVIYAAQTLGLSERTIFWKIRIPMAKPGILSGTVLAFARAIGEYGATSMLAGNIAGRTSTISQQIAMVLQNGDFALAGFWCLVIFVISFVCLVALNLFGEKKSKGKKHVFHRKNKKTTGSL